MRHPRTAVFCLILLGLGGCGDRPSKTARESPTNPADSTYEVAPADTTWPDPAPHRASLASNGRVRIHYLDFGGSGMMNGHQGTGNVSRNTPRTQH